MTPELTFDARAFPAAPPPDLDDPRSIVQHDWNSFSAIDRMVNHWDRPGWQGNRRAYYWLLTFPRAHQLTDRVRHCQNALVHLEMNLVPEAGLHVTMVRVGDTGQVARAEVDHVVEQAEALALESFEIRAHPIAGSRGALRLSLTPWTPLVRLHSALSDVNHRVGVPGGKPTSSFRPHLGLAYNNRDRAAAPAVEAAAALRSLPPVSLHVGAIELVELRRDRATYRWHVLHRLRLR